MRSFADAPAPQHIYLDRAYSYARWEVLVGGIVALVVAAPLLYFSIRAVPGTDWSQVRWWQWSLPVLFGLGLPALFVWVGFYLLHGWVTGRIQRLVISEQGIAYAGKLRPWADIAWLAWSYVKQGQPSLFYQIHGFFSVDRHLMVDGLTEDEIAELLGRLREDIGPHFPKLRIG